MSAHPFIHQHAAEMTSGSERCHPILADMVTAQLLCLHSSVSSRGYLYGLLYFDVSCLLNETTKLSFQQWDIHVAQAAAHRKEVSSGA